jgi:hypothetical protein
MTRRVALVGTVVSEERNASFIRVTKIGELGTMLAVISNRRTPFFIDTAERALNLTRKLGFTPAANQITG